MNAKQNKWLHILETTTRHQAVRRLAIHRGKGRFEYCCLGLVCHLVEHIKPTHNVKGLYFNGERVSLPSKAELNLHFRSGEGEIAAHLKTDFDSAIRKVGYNGLVWASLAGYNDGGATFKQIAAAIRACPQAVFTNIK